MSTSPLKIEVDSYWRIIKDASNEVKLRLISMLSESMTTHSEFSGRDTDKTEVFLSKYAGAWAGDESADEIISTLRSNRSIRKPISLD